MHPAPRHDNPETDLTSPTILPELLGTSWYEPIIMGLSAPYRLLYKAYLHLRYPPEKELPPGKI